MSDTNVTEQLAETGIINTNVDTNLDVSAENTSEEIKEVEKKEEVKIEENKQEDKFAAKFAALSRKEKQLREREKTLEASQKSIEEQIKKLEEQYKQKEQELSSKLLDPSLFKKDAKEALNKAGLTFEELAQLMINDGKPTAEMLLTDAEKRLQAKIEDMEKKLMEKEAKEQEAKYEEVLNNFVSEITTFVNDNNDYELIRANDATDLVYEVIEEHHSTTGEILQIKQAADAVEQYLLEEAKKQLNLGKIKGLLSPKEQQEAKEKPTEGKASVTLSNTQAAQVPKQGQQRLSDEQSKVEAAKLIRWET